MQIQIISVEQEKKEKYSKLSIKFLNDKGQSNGKDLMSFGASKDAFLILSQAKEGDMYDVKAVKNDKGFWDWTEVKKMGNKPVEAAKSLPTGNNRGFETPEERANRQVMIVRQSSLSTAVEFLNHNKKNYELQEVINTAKEFEAFVFGNPVKETVEILKDDTEGVV